jgi:acyl-CoA reductase-like NAD-dependent aldehyde dehydrogenase
MHIDPCDGHTVLDQVPLQSTDEIDAAIVRLTGSAPDHRPPSPTERAAALERWARGLRQRADEAASLIVRQVGKPLRDARAEVAYGLALLEASLSQTLADADEGGRMRQRPGGLTAIVTAWNNPFAIPIGKLAPALGSGNPVVWKPAPAGSAVARWLLQSLAEADLGAQVTAVLGDARAALALADHPAVARLSFTGSLAGGRALAWRCAARMIPFQGELGGNNAAIVMPDADLDAVVADLAPAMFSFAGQRCTAIRRIIVHRDAHPALSRCLADAVAALSTAAPGAEDTVLGPVISRHKQTSLQGLIQEGLSAGGRILARGSVGADLPEGGFWLPATVLQDVPDDSPLVMDEQFGPVAVVQTARDLDHALALANGTGYGLLAALYSGDANTLERFEADARAGILSINRARPAFDPALPFGGWSGSGMGMPEHGGWGRAFNALPQAVYRHAAPRAPDPHDSASARSSCHSG